MAMLEWKPPLSPEWGEWKSTADALLTEAENGAELSPDAQRQLAECLHRMAGEKLGPMQQLQLERLARRAVQAVPQLEPFRFLRVGIVSDRTLDFLAPALQAAGLARLLLIEPVLAPPGSAASLAFGAGDPFGGPVDIVLYWHDATMTHARTALLDTQAQEAAIHASTAGLRQTVEALQAKCRADVLVSTTPLPPAQRVSSIDAITPGSMAAHVAQTNAAVFEGAARGDWTLIDIAALAADVGHASWFDPMRLFDLKVPFAMELNPVVADHVARHLAGAFGKARRALVLDLDNTLWGGVIGDDGLEGIEVGQGSAAGEAYLALQQLALTLKDRGVALCVCSKNNDETARQPFAEHPDMLLRLDDFAVFHASWDDKASGVRAIAQALRLGPESLVFMDDNPAERARVRQELPFVFVPELPEQPFRYATILAASGAFEHGLLSGDDLARAQSYGSDAKRVEMQAAIGNYEDYLRALQMEISITPFDDIGLPRIAQLVAKSNQFNLTTRRHGKDELARMQASGDVLCWQVRLSDRFADHGMIAVVIVAKRGEDWVIDTWLQSCRILQRGVEQEIANRLVEAARREGAGRVLGEYIPTSKNALVADLFPRLGFAAINAPAYGDEASEWFACEVDGFTAHATFFGSPDAGHPA
ncbi:HAD-IIIC family phosphatase [Citromicrobium bathyomarinum]